MTEPDLTVYDLAARAASGLPVSSAATKEIAVELLRARDMHDLHRQIGIYEERLSVAREKQAHWRGLAEKGAYVITPYDVEKNVKDYEAHLASLRAMVKPQ